MIFSVKHVNTIVKTGTFRLNSFLLVLNTAAGLFNTAKLVINNCNRSC